MRIDTRPYSPANPYRVPEDTCTIIPAMSNATMHAIQHAYVSSTTLEFNGGKAMAVWERRTQKITFTVPSPSICSDLKGQLLDFKMSH